MKLLLPEMGVPQNHWYASGIPTTKNQEHGSLGIPHGFSFLPHIFDSWLDMLILTFEFISIHIYPYHIPMDLGV